MKQFVIAIMAVATVSFVACNNGSDSANKNESNGHADMGMESTGTISAGKKDVEVIQASFSNVNSDVSAHINEVLGHYFHVKHALTQDDATEAKNGATMLLKVLSRFDQSLLPAEQKTEYAKQIQSIKEHADAIVKSADLDNMRMHFSELSKPSYELVKAFGAGKKVYYSHCPMALDNKGADWLNETAAIQNPYMGTRMPTCGTVEKIIE